MNERKQHFPTATLMDTYVDTVDETPTLIKEGAEGKVFRTSYMTQDCVVKERVKKGYRVPELDSKLNKTRLLHEARCMVKCKKMNIAVPEIFMVDVTAFRLHMEFIDGKTLKQVLIQSVDSSDSSSYAPFLDLARKIGTTIANMHGSDIIHGDLTSSNIMIRSGSDEVVLVDFGLGSVSCTAVEEKAVDLYVLERALLATHPGSEVFSEAILSTYGSTRAHAKAGKVLERLEAVRQRGRKREMVG